MRNSQFTTLLLATAFVLISWSGTWFEITATGTYTEGLEREPTISTHYMIDSDMEAIDITIDNATSLLLYWMEREDVNNGGEQQQPDSNSSESGGDGQAATTSSDEEPCAGSCLDSARSAVRMSMLVFLVVFSASIVRPRLELKMAAVAVWLVGAVIIVAAVPLAAAMDFGIAEGDEDDSEGGGGSSTGGFDSTAQETVEADQFAHFHNEADMGLDFIGIVFTYDSEGYDLGLLEEGDRQAVIDEAPEEGEPGYESFIRFHGEMSIGPGPIVIWWLLLAPLLLLSLRGFRETIEDE